MILSVYVDDKTHEILTRFSAETGRKIEELADAAVAEAALDCARSRGWLRSPTEELTPDADPQPILTDADHAHGGKWK